MNNPCQNGSASLLTEATVPPPNSPAQLAPAEPGLQKRIGGRQSKISRLPKATRDRLNFMLRDGLQYEDILAKLGDEAKDITARNVSTWHIGPAYQHWAAEQEWLEDLRTEQESAFDLLNDFESSKFNQGALQLAITRLFLAFRHIDAGELNQKLGGNARTFAGLVHALARASRENTNIEKYRDACARAVAAELKQLNEDRELSDREFELVVNRMDRVFKMPHPLLASIARPPASTNGPKTQPLPTAQSAPDAHEPLDYPSGPKAEAQVGGNQAPAQELCPTLSITLSPTLSFP